MAIKLVLDDALGNHRPPEWLAWAHNYGFGHHTLGVALFAGTATLAIAVVWRGPVPRLMAGEGDPYCTIGEVWLARLVRRGE
ncbi:hypothetical protein ACVWW1_000182 [Bradyrhizobium sp. JR3.5]